MIKDIVLRPGMLQRLDYIASVTSETAADVINRLINVEFARRRQQVAAFRAKHAPHDVATSIPRGDGHNPNPDSEKAAG